MAVKFPKIGTQENTGSALNRFTELKRYAEVIGPVSPFQVYRSKS